MKTAAWNTKITASLFLLCTSVFLLDAGAQVRRSPNPPYPVGPDGQPIYPGNPNTPGKANLNGRQQLTKDYFEGTVKATSLIKKTLTVQHGELATKTFKLSGDCNISTVEKPNGTASLADIKICDTVSVSMDGGTQGYIMTAYINDTTPHPANKPAAKAK